MTSLTLSRAKSKLEKYQEQKNKNSTQISKIQNQLFYLGNREKAISKINAKNEKLDENILQQRAKITKIIDSSLFNKANNVLRKLTGAKIEDKASEYRDSSESKDFKDFKESKNSEKSDNADNTDNTKESKNSEENKPLKLSENKDIITPAKKDELNEQVYNHLVEIGETDSANYVLDLMTKPKKVSEKDDNFATKDDVKRLTEVDEGILQTLKKISDDMVDEQPDKLPNSKPEIKTQTKVTTPKPKVKKENKSSWFTKMLSGLIGGALLGFLVDSKYMKIGQIAFKLLKLGGNFIFKGLAKMGSGVVKFLMGKLEPLVTKVKKMVKWGKKMIAPLVTKVNNIIQWGKDAIKTITTSFEKFKGIIKNSIKNVVKFIPKKLIPKSLSKFLGIKVSKAVKVAGETEKVSAKLGGKVASKLESKVSSKITSKIAKEATEKGLGKLALKSAGKAGAKSLLKKIPFVGIGISAGLALQRGLKGDMVGAGLEIASGILGTLGAFSFGAGTAASVGIDAILLARDLKNKPKEVKSPSVPSTSKSSETSKTTFTNKPKSSSFLANSFKHKSTSQTPKTNKFDNDDYINDELKQEEQNWKPNNDELKAKNKHNSNKHNLKNSEKIKDTFKLYHNPDVEGLNPSVKSNLTSLGEEYLTLTGKKMQINSAFRDVRQQEREYKANPKKAAKPGNSMHNYGYAVDINTSDLNKADTLGLLDKYNFHRNLIHAKYPETWHLEPKGINREAIKTYMTPGDGPEMSKKEDEDAKKPEVTKTPKESVVNNTSTNLTNNTKKFSLPKDISPQPQASQQSINSNVNINNNKEYTLADNFDL